MMKKNIFKILLLALPLMVVGCKSEPKVAEVKPLGRSNMGYLVEGWYNTDGTFTGTDLDAKSGSSRYKFGVTYLAGRQVDGFKKAQLTIRNETKNFISLQYRFFWYDAEGMEIESDSTAWQPLHLSGKLSRTISNTARRSEAVHFKIYIRELK